MRCASLLDAQGRRWLSRRRDLAPEDEAFRDNPPNPNYQKGKPPNEALVPLYTTDLPEVHDVIAVLRRTVDEFRPSADRGDIPASGAPGCLLRSRPRRCPPAVQLRAAWRSLGREVHSGADR